MRRHKKVKMKPPWLQRLLQTSSRPTTSSKLKWQIICALTPIIICILLSIDTHCDAHRSATNTTISSKSISSLNRLHSSETNLNASVTVDTPVISSNRIDNDGTDEFNGEEGGDLGPDRSSPRFAQNQDSTVIASIYQNEVYLPCKILNLDEEQTVSWIRKHDSLVLTINKLRLIDDNRFQLAQANDDWTLVLRQPTDSDAGFYECQVSSLEPKLSHSIELRLVRAESMISNLSSLFVRPNDTVNLTCTIFAPQPTQYVYWYKNAKEFVQFDNNLIQQQQHSKRDTDAWDEHGAIDLGARIVDQANSNGRLPSRIQRRSVYDLTQKPDAVRRGVASNTGKARGKSNISGGGDKVVTVVSNVVAGEADNGDKDDKDDDEATIKNKYGKRRTKTDSSESSIVSKSNSASSQQQRYYATARRTGPANNNEPVKSEINKKSSESLILRGLKLGSKERKEEEAEEAGEESEQDNGGNNKPQQQQQQADRHFLVHSSSSLIIKQAQLNDTANYTCSPSNAKPSHINLVVVENGLGSQPEKRSLQVDSASSLLTNQFKSHLWSKVRLLASSLIYKFAPQWRLMFEHNSQSPVPDKKTGEHEYGGQDQDIMEIISARTLIGELFADQNIWRSILLITTTICMMLLYH